MDGELFLSESEMKTVPFITISKSGKFNFSRRDRKRCVSNVGENRINTNRSKEDSNVLGIVFV